MSQSAIVSLSAHGGRIKVVAAAAALCLGLIHSAHAAGQPDVDRADATSTTVSDSKTDSKHDTWVFAYFRQRYDSRVEIDDQGRTHTIPLPNPMRVEQLHLALSNDGRHWTPLNGNRPVWNHWLRDPFIRRDAAGLWHLVATGGARGRRNSSTNQGPSCLYAVSTNLITWTDVQSLHPMQGVHDATGRRPRNIWAPEWFLDHQTGDYVLIWSSSFEDAGWKKSRIWFCRTRDWKTFTKAEVLFHPDYSVIDATMVQKDGKYYLFHKEEEFGAITGERRAIRLAIADQLAGPYRVVQGPLNGGQIAPTITEGPSVMPDPQKAGWLLLYDFCMADGYGASSSPDLIHWTVEKSVDFPPDARHGSVAHITSAEAAQLRAAFPGND